MKFLCYNLVHAQREINISERLAEEYYKLHQLAHGDNTILHVAAGVFTIAVNTGPLPDEALLSQGANLLFHSMQEFCDEWENVYEVLKA